MILEILRALFLAITVAQRVLGELALFLGVFGALLMITRVLPRIKSY